MVIPAWCDGESTLTPFSVYLSLLLALGSWFWQFMFGGGDQAREPLGIVNFFIDQKEIFGTFVGRCLEYFADVGATRVSWFDEQPVVANQCDDLALRIQGSPAKHVPVRDVALVADLVAYVLDEIRVVRHTPLPAPLF